jgi:hypothetical protein
MAQDPYTDDANTLSKFLEEPETLRDFLNRRKRELAAQVAALKGQIAPKEQELRDIDAAIAALPAVAPDHASARNALISSATRNALISSADHKNGLTVTLRSGQNWLAADATHVHAPAALKKSPYQQMTIKELVVQALIDNFPQGATAPEIRAFIRDAYDRDIESSSLRPQMHRLKSDGKLVTASAVVGSGDVWNLEPQARMLYARYDHPTSRSAMKELQDDPSSNE